MRVYCSLMSALIDSEILECDGEAIATAQKLAKEEKSDKVTFTMKAYLEREAELLAQDSHSFDESQWSENEEF